MKVDKLSRLFEALNQPSSTPKVTDLNAKRAKVASAPSDAVNISAELNRAKADTVGRETRVADLKAQVQAGNYNPDSRLVAQAIEKDLFI